MAIAGSGAVAEGLAAIRQSIQLILTTTPGTDPMRPEFGSDVYKYVDTPLPTAIPNMKKAILEALALWEPRIKVTAIPHGVKNNSNVLFSITYDILDDNISDTLDIIPGVPLAQPLILQGLFPPNPSAYRYTVSGKLNGSDILPPAPEGGFTSTTDLYNWVHTNWAGFGRWYLNADRVVGYIKPQYNTGSIEVGLLAKTRFAAAVPVLQIGEYYTISIMVDGVVKSNTAPGELLTGEDLRSWAQAQFNELGAWMLEAGPGEFNDDFNEDYYIYSLQLTILTDQADNVSIEINIAS